MGDDVSFAGTSSSSRTAAGTSSSFPTGSSSSISALPTAAGAGPSESVSPDPLADVAFADVPGFERAQVTRLQSQDPEFVDIVLAHRIMSKIEAGADRPELDQDELYRKLRDGIDDSAGRLRAKRADVALKSFGS